MDTIYNGFSKSGGTYKILNKINNKIYYGSCKCFTKRQYQHLKLLEQNKHGNSHLQNAFNQYGSEAFVFEIVEAIEGSKQDRLDAEQKLLDQYWDNCVNCYNIEKHAWSREGKKSKNPSPMKGRIPWNKGKKTGHIPWNKGLIGGFSEEVIQKIKEARAKQVFAPEVNAKRVANRIGVPRTEEVKQKIGKANSVNMKELWQNPEYRQRMLEAHKKRKKSKNTYLDSCIDY